MGRKGGNGRGGRKKERKKGDGQKNPSLQNPANANGLTDAIYSVTAMVLRRKKSCNES